jgi:hypothetical protein
MQFDRHTIVLLVRPPDAPELSGQELEALQDAHLARPGRPAYSGLSGRCGAVGGPAAKVWRYPRYAAKANW